MSITAIVTALFLLAPGLDAPSASEDVMSPTPSTSAGSEAPSSTGVTSPTSEEEASKNNTPLHWGLQYGIGVAATAVAVPVSLYLGAGIGSLSNDLLGAGIPTLLCVTVIPSAAVTFATVIAGNWRNPGRYRWWPALLATFVVNVASFAVATALGVSVGVPGRVIAYTAIEALLQPAVAVALERLFPREERPVEVSGTAGALSRTSFIPAGSWSFSW